MPTRHCLEPEWASPEDCWLQCWVDPSREQGKQRQTGELIDSHILKTGFQTSDCKRICHHVYQLSVYVTYILQYCNTYKWKGPLTDIMLKVLTKIIFLCSCFQDNKIISASPLDKKRLYAPQSLYAHFVFVAHFLHLVDKLLFWIAILYNKIGLDWRVYSVSGHKRCFPFSGFSWFFFFFFFWRWWIWI